MTNSAKSASNKKKNTLCIRVFFIYQDIDFTRIAPFFTIFPLKKCPVLNEMDHQQAEPGIL